MAEMEQLDMWWWEEDPLIKPRVEEPSLVYHYTSIETLRLIHRSGTWRLAHADYLNDPLERELVYRAFEKALRAEGGELAARFPDAGRSEIQRERLAPFMASFSEEKESMLMWSMYCGFGGVAVGCDPTLLRSMRIGQGDLAFRPVVYGAEEPDRFAGEVLAHLRREAQIPESPGGDEWYRRHWPAEALAKAASVVKLPHWSGEREWRLIRSINVPDGDKLRSDFGLRHLLGDWQEQSGRVFIEATFEESPIKTLHFGPCVDRVVGQLLAIELNVEPTFPPPVIRCA